MRDPADQLIEARNPPVVPYAVARGHRKIVLTRHKARTSAVAVPHPRTATPPRSQTTAVVLACPVPGMWRHRGTSPTEAKRRRILRLDDQVEEKGRVVVTQDDLLYRLRLGLPEHGLR